MNPVQEPQLSIENSSQEIDNVNSLPASVTRCTIEDYIQCSKSHLWKLMMSFYDRKGPESWAQGIVPHFITSNAFIGRAYAKIVHGYIRDCFRAHSKTHFSFSEPLYIIELGTGSGKFSFFMLKALEELQDCCDFPFNKIIYVMTDFTKTNFDFWSNHPALKPYFDNGRLDAAIFDAVTDTEIYLWKSKAVLGLDSSNNPIIVIANYLFDTLYHDIFQVEGGVLKEGLVSVGSKLSDEPDPLDPEIITRLDNQYKYNPISAESYYTAEEGDEIHLSRILQWYEHRFKAEAQGASLLFPIGALRALRRLTKISNGHVLVISGDKGNSCVDHFVGLSDPHIAVHGSFSLMVNYHAIGAWFTSRGGFALHNPQEEASLKVSCFVLQPELNGNPFTNGDVWTSPRAYLDRDQSRAKAFPSLRHSFAESISLFGPNDFFVLQKSIKEDMTTTPLRTVIALLKLSDWDPDVFFKFKDVILQHAPTGGAKLISDMCRGVSRVWENHYALDFERDVAFEVGRFYYGIKDFAKALHFYTISIDTVGPHHVTCHNQGLCYYSMGDIDTSLTCFKRATEIDPTYEKARHWIEKVNKEKAVTANAGPNISQQEKTQEISQTNGFTANNDANVVVAQFSRLEIDIGSVGNSTSAEVPVFAMMR